MLPVKGSKISASHWPIDITYGSCTGSFGVTMGEYLQVYLILAALPHCTREQTGTLE